MAKYKGILIGAIVAILLITGTVVIMMEQKAKEGNEAVESSGGPATLSWPDLRQLDFKTKQAPESLKQHDRRKVRIPGFVVPLEDNAGEFAEFLLVPDAQACVHVPPPPANQMVHVKMKSGEKLKPVYGPVWVEGILRIVDVESVYGTASYEMRGLTVTPYKM